MHPRESGITTTTAHSLYWAAYGPGDAPRLFVLHGGPGASHDYLLPQMLQLAERYDAVFYDQRGGGRSRSDDRAPITWRTHVEDLAQAARELGGGSPITLVGYSWGGLLSLLYAARRHEIAGATDGPAPARLVLIDPAPITRQYRREFEAEFERRKWTAAVQAMRAELAGSGLRERDPEGYRHRLFELSVAGYFADPRAARDLTPFRVIERVQQSVWESLGDYDLTSALRAVRAPALLVHGREDPIPLRSSQDAADAMGARLVVLERCGHVPYVEQPAALFDAVGRFLDETDGGIGAERARPA